VYDDLFVQLDEEEEECESNEDEGYQSAPRFGNSKSSPLEVAEFYKYWSNFVTRRDFGWAEKYKLSEVSFGMTYFD
jgi:hypothetical protein